MALFNPASNQKAIPPSIASTNVAKQPNASFNPQHYITFHVNNFLSTPEGQKVMETSFKNNPELLQHAQAIAAIHKNIMENMKNKMALDDDHGILQAPPTLANPQKGHVKSSSIPLNNQNGMLG